MLEIWLYKIEMLKEAINEDKNYFNSWEIENIEKMEYTLLQGKELSNSQIKMLGRLYSKI